MNSLPEVHRQLLGELGLADAGRAGEEEAAGRAIGLAEAGARALDGARDGAHGLFLPEHDASERFLEAAEPVAIRRGRLLGRNARHARDDLLDVRGGDLDRRRESAVGGSSTSAPPRPPRASAAAAVAGRSGMGLASPRVKRAFAPASSSTSMALSGSL